MAVLTVLVTMAILTILVFELAFSTGVQSRLARTFNETAQAKYLAKSAQNLSLLRVYLYLNLLNMTKSVTLPISPKDLSQLYSVPLPPFPFDDQVLALFPVAVRIGLEKFAKESVVGQMQRAQFASDIRGLSGKIPVNFLDGEPERFSSTKFQKLFFQLITQIITEQKEKDKNFDEKYRERLPEDWVWGLVNYIDLDNIEQPTNQLEDTYFQQFVPPEFLRHRRFRFKEDLALPKYWDDELVRRFGNLFNLYAFYPYINVNDAPSAVLKVLFGNPQEEQMNALSERLTQGWFKDYQEVEAFRQVQNIRTEKEDPFKRIMTFYEQGAFQINARGIVGDTTQEYTTIVVLKPSEKIVKKTSQEIRDMIRQHQKKIEESGNVESEEITKQMQDPFNFFKDEKAEQEVGAHAGEDEVQQSAKPAGKKPQKDPQKGKNIFEESPEQIEIVYWGDSV